MFRLTLKYEIVGLLFFCFIAHSAPSPVVQTMEKIKQIDIKIGNLQKKLSTVQDKRGVLREELSKTEEQMGKAENTLLSLRKDIQDEEHKIFELQQALQHLNKQLALQQELLANHVRARYQMSEYQPIKWLLNQDNTPYQINRMFTYYQYVVKSRQQLITQIDETRKKITEKKEQLRAELTKNQGLQGQMLQHQQQLQQNKSYHTTLIQSLNHEIQSSQQALVHFKKDKDHLAHLLKSLAQQSSFQSSRPFAQMRKKLPIPVQIAPGSLQKRNQGVTFFAKEGAVVSAVYPGKVVFSDWLNGYGLLLILDHGQGYMTLYAHNKALFRHKGQMVQQREQIASVGHSGGIKQDGLYFEVRWKGKAVSPLDWLGNTSSRT